MLSETPRVSFSINATTVAFRGMCFTGIYKPELLYSSNTAGVDAYRERRNLADWQQKGQLSLMQLEGEL